MIRFTEIDGLRGFLAWWVVAGHLLQWSGFHRQDLSLFWQLFYTPANAVNVFMIVSGFVIFFLLDKLGEGYPAFITRRLLRLFPVYIICLLLAVAIQGILLQSRELAPWISEYISYETDHRYFWSHLIAHIGMLHGVIPEEILPNSYLAFLGPAWSISLEWQFYLVAPLVFVLIRRYPITTLFFLGIIVVFEKYPNLIGTLPASLPVSAKFFCIGICSYYMLKASSGEKSFAAMIPPYFLLIVAVLVMVFTRSAALIAWAVVFFAVLIHTQDDTDRIGAAVRGIMNSRFAQFLGKISYPTYMIHIIIINLCQWFILRMDSSLYKGDMLVLLASMAIPAIIAAAWCLHVLVEQPCIDYAKKLTRPWKRSVY